MDRPVQFEKSGRVIASFQIQTVERARQDTDLYDLDLDSPNHIPYISTIHFDVIYPLLRLIRCFILPKGYILLPLSFCWFLWLTWRPSYLSLPPATATATTTTSNVLFAHGSIT